MPYSGPMRRKLFGLLILSALGCQVEAALPPGAASRPAYPPKRMANTYDVVAYVENAAAIEGQRTFQTVHDGGLYFFSSQANLDKFRVNPTHYAPAFNGWCACGMAKGLRLPPSGQDFQVVDGQLYLFHDAAVHEAWRAQRAEMLEKGKENWVRLK